MTRAAREGRAAAAARRGEVEWAVQAYINLWRLHEVGEQAGLARATRDTLAVFLRQCPPTIRMVAEGVLAVREPDPPTGVRGRRVEHVIYDEAQDVQQAVLAGQDGEGSGRD